MLEHGVHGMKQLDGDHDQRLLGRFALGLGHAEYSKVLSGTLFQSFALTGWVAQAGLPQVARGGEETWGGMNSTKHEALPGVPQVRLGVSEASPRENNSLNTSLVQNRASRGPFLYNKYNYNKYNKAEGGDSEGPAADVLTSRPTVCGTPKTETATPALKPTRLCPVTGRFLRAPPWHSGCSIPRWRIARGVPAR